jgi:SET domain-containing protein
VLVGEGKEQPSDPFQIDDNEYLDLEETSRSFNHSCDPNIFVRGKNEMVSLRDIEEGEELTFDYSTTMKYDAEKIQAAGFELWTCQCACGAANCRGIIDEFKTLPASLQAKYRQNGWLPDFLMR